MDNATPASHPYMTHPSTMTRLRYFNRLLFSTGSASESALAAVDTAGEEADTSPEVDPVHGPHTVPGLRRPPDQHLQRDQHRLPALTIAALDQRTRQRSNETLRARLTCTFNSYPGSVGLSSQP